MSLQSMVFCEHPYFNEPGFEASAGTASGDSRSAAYNASVRSNAAQHAILAPLQNPDAQPHCAFKDVLALHWRAKRTHIKQHLERSKLPQASQICTLLDALS